MIMDVRTELGWLLAGLHKLTQPFLQECRVENIIPADKESLAYTTPKGLALSLLPLESSMKYSIGAIPVNFLKVRNRSF